MKKLKYKNSALLRQLLGSDLSTNLLRPSVVASAISGSFDFHSTPEGAAYWSDVCWQIRHGTMSLDAPLKAKLVAIMLMPTEIEEVGR